MMTEYENLNYKHIASAIDYLKSNSKNQPTLDEITQHLNLSPVHFQRLFIDWAGTSPKKFLQYISLEHAKGILRSNLQNTLFDTSFGLGFSINNRLHKLFVNIQEMNPSDYQQGGKNLTINFSFATSPFGSIIVGSTSKGICYMAFEEDKEIALSNLKAKFPRAVFYQKTDSLHQKVMCVFKNDRAGLSQIKLHLKGTDFQLKVWESLLTIPLGQLVTYGTLAKKLGSPKASRAIGTAIGNNPIAYLIPCHRVVQQAGTFGGYMWGTTRKTAIIGWEQAQLYK